MPLLARRRCRSALVGALLASAALPSAGFAEELTAPPAASSNPPAASAATTPEAIAAKPDAAAAGEKPKTGEQTKSGEQRKAGEQSSNGAKAGDVGQTTKRESAGADAKDPRAADRQAFFDARLASLHAGLTLTSDQEPLWNAVASAIRDLQKSRGRRLDRDQVANLLDESPSDLLRMRSEQLIRRGEAMKALVDATGPLLDKLDDGQKRRLPLLLVGLRPAGILRAAFDIRYGRVQDDPDDDTGAASRHDERGAANGVDGGADEGMGRHHRPMHDGGYGRGDDREGAAYDDGRGDPTAMQDRSGEPADD